MTGVVAITGSGSVASTVNENVPVVVGIPLRMPVAGSRVSPGGSEPSATVNGGLPLNVWE